MYEYININQVDILSDLRDIKKSSFNRFKNVGLRDVTLPLSILLEFKFRQTVFLVGPYVKKKIYSANFMCLGQHWFGLDVIESVGQGF